MNKKEDIRYCCPSCGKEYRHIGWYKRHCLNKHSAILPYKTKKVLDKRDIDSIFNKIESLESKIDTLITQGIPIQHDINIKRITPKQILEPTTEYEKAKMECINELKSIFSEGIKVLGKMEDMELGIKTKEEINQILQEKIQS